MKHKSIKLFATVAALATVACLGSCTQQSPTSILNLTNWDFSKDSVEWSTVVVPHSYNGEDGRTQKYYRGKAYYRNTLNLSSKEAKQPLFICFEGAAQQATVYLNGTPIVHHKGGYTPFFVNLSYLVKEGSNEIIVACDNTLDLTLAPVDSDFNKNGGLHNPVSLFKMNPVYFSTENYGLKRLHVCTPEVNNEEATILLETAVHNSAYKDIEAIVRYVVRDAENQVVLDASHTLNVAEGEETPARMEAKLDNPHLWNGVADPYLYTATVEVSVDGKTTDQVCTKFGVRYFQMDREKGFSLNGQPYPLRGVSIHQDLEGKATGMTYADYEKDYEIVKELGCNFVRLAHYPHNSIAFDLCDSLGLVVQTEIPWVNVCGVRAEPAYFENLHSQMKEMVTSHFNHPSICFWGIFNEVAGWGNKEHLQGSIDYDKVLENVASLYDLAKSLDAYRYVGLTDCELLHPEAYPNLKADYISENRYYGWYYGKFDEFTPAIKSVWEKDKITNVSEYGAGVNPYCHTWNTDSINNKVNAKHYEEWGNLYHEAHLTQIEAMPWLNFTSLWILFDFAVASRQEGYMSSNDGVTWIEDDSRKYTNDKGLVTRDRSLRKDAFYLYKAKWNSTEETVYITGRRLEKIPANHNYTIKVYSNAKALSLYRGDTLVQTLEASGEPTGVIWKFAPIQLNGAEETFRVVSADGTEDVITLKSL